MTEKEPLDDASDVWSRYKSRIAFLLMAENEREKWPGKNKFHRLLAELARHCVDFVILYCEHELEERLAETLDPLSIRALASALAGKGAEQTTGRHYIIGKELIQAGVYPLREMLAGDRYFMMIEQTLEYGKRQLIMLPHPEAELRTNPGYLQEREWVQRELDRARGSASEAGKSPK